MNFWRSTMPRTRRARISFARCSTAQPAITIASIACSRSVPAAGIGVGCYAKPASRVTLAREALHLVGDPRRVIGLDPSENMLARARAALGIAMIQGRAEALPIADGGLDFVTMGYALRHVATSSQHSRSSGACCDPGARR